jgi:isoaspartyl peptidase/L-asparaginase-like protein (Ntn-hydrolase superfamily)
MQQDRRRFLKTSAAGTAGLIVGCGLRGEPAPLSAAGNLARSAGSVVLSTWRHGLPANARAMEVLAQGGPVLDAVMEGVAVVEGDFSNRSVGLGGLPDRDGLVTLDACLMDHRGRAGAVAFLQGFRHPIMVARAIMEHTPHVMLVGAGAERWAAENGFQREPQPDIPEVRKAWQDWLRSGEYAPKANIENHDTISMVAVDANGILAGSCTTSGLAWKVHGRVGDSPIIGAGLYVDGEVGAACATGVGELVMRTVGSHAVVEMMAVGVEPEEACRRVVQRILARNPGLRDQQVGMLALRRDGVHGSWSIHPGFNFALSREGEETRLEDAQHEKPWPGEGE